MRNGVLLAEDSPSNIMQLFRVDNLQDAFLQLSTKQENNIKESIEGQTQLEFHEINTVQENTINTEEHDVKMGAKFGIKMKALVNKNLIQMLRRPMLVFSILYHFPSHIFLSFQGINFHSFSTIYSNMSVLHMYWS